eukprot:5144198-Lingulodinium_polyedra.AAC.1
MDPQLHTMRTARTSASDIHAVAQAIDRLITAHAALLHAHDVRSSGVKRPLEQPSPANEQGASNTGGLTSLAGERAHIG